MFIVKSYNDELVLRITICLIYVVLSRLLSQLAYELSHQYLPIEPKQRRVVYPASSCKNASKLRRK